MLEATLLRKQLEEKMKHWLNLTDELNRHMWHPFDRDQKQWEQRRLEEEILILLARLKQSVQ